MAMLYECGFEAGSWAYYQANGWTSAGTPTFFTAAGSYHTSMSSNGGVRSFCPAWSSTISPNLGANDGWMSFWLAPMVGATGGTRDCEPTFFASYDGTGADYAQASVNFSRYGCITVLTSGLYVIDGVSASFNPAVSHWISIYMKCRYFSGVFPYTTAGNVKVYIDGVKVIDYSGNLAYYIYPDHLTQWNKVGWQGAFNGIIVDDLVIHDDDFTGPLPERFIPAIVPNGDNAIELTRSTGSTNYSCVDEIPPVTTDYCSTAITNKADHYNMTTIGWTPDTIDAVGVWTYAMQNGTIVDVRHGLYNSSGPTEYTKTKTLTTSGTYYADLYIFETEPISSTAWDKTEIDAAVSTARLV